MRLKGFVSLTEKLLAAILASQITIIIIDLTILYTSYSYVFS